MVSIFISTFTTEGDISCAPI